MCYSAQIQADYRRYVREFGADITLKEFYDLFWRRQSDSKIKIPKAMEMAFADPQNEEQRAIKGLIDSFCAAEKTRLEQELFKQRKRLADAERTLQAKTTNAALESKRIASNKIEAAMARLSDLHRSRPENRDSRIFPGHYAPVLVVEDGRRVVKPMRYQCRPAGKPAFYDTKFPGTYNARRDNLDGFWKDLFGFSHGIMVVSAFYENVTRTVAPTAPGDEPQQKNVVLEFNPSPPQDMLVACLWSRWSEPGQPDLLSFAAITDDPPAEVAAAGHDRCIVPIKPENVDAWLNPGASTRAALHAILEDRARPYYEHRLAA